MMHRGFAPIDVIIRVALRLTEEIVSLTYLLKTNGIWVRKSDATR